MLFCISCLLLLRTLIKCYCVKCSKILPVSFFYILQGGAATHLRFGKDFVANILENTTVKEF